MKVKAPVIVLLVVIMLSSCSFKQNIPPTISLPTSTSISPTTSFTASESPGLPFSTSYKIIPAANSENIISIKNQGKVTLKNLMVKICTVQISSSWQQDIQDITSLVIEPKSLASKFTQEYHYDDNCFSVRENGNINAALLSFESLPVDQYIDITIKMKSTVDKPERDYEGKAYIKIPADLFSDETNNGIIIGNTIFLFGDSLVYFFAEKWALAHLYVQIKCDSCIDSWESYGYSLFKERNVVNCEIHSKDDSFIRMSCGFLFKYYANDASNLLPEKETFYFFVTRNSDSKSGITPITREQYESNSIK